MGPGPPDTTARGRVLVIGAQGVLGTFLARAFAEAGWEVVRGGRRPEAASDFCQLDLDVPNTLHQVCGDVDVVVSTVPHLGIAAERAVLRGGGALLNVARMTAAERAELEAEQEDARGLVVVHAGLAPGVTTLVAAELLLAHPEADAIEVVMTFSAATAGGRAGAAFGYRLLTGAVHHPTVTVPLPPPFGRRRCFDVGMATEGWLTAVAGGRDTHLRICLAERPIAAALLTLNALRLLWLLPRVAFVGGRRTIPPELTREPVCEWVAVSRDGRRLGATIVEGAGDYQLTVGATFTFAEATLARRRTAPELAGVCGVETLFSLKQLRPTLEKRGIRVRPAPAF
jgi:hypothetical protein